MEMQLSIMGRVNAARRERVLRGRRVCGRAPRAECNRALELRATISHLAALATRAARAARPLADFHSASPLLLSASSSLAPRRALAHWRLAAINSEGPR